MGRLLAYPKDFAFSHNGNTTPGLDPEWYFTQEAAGRYNGTAWDVSSTFPYPAAIHNDIMIAKSIWPQDKAKDQARRLKVEIRTFIEQEIANTVIWTHEWDSYYFAWPPKGDRPEAVITEVKHGYHVFNFVTQAETLLFKFRFADQVTAPTEWHPDYQPGEDTMINKHEWELRTQIREKWGYGAVPRDSSLW